jgi:NAD+ kinase
MKPLRRIAFVVNAGKEGALQYAGRLIDSVSPDLEHHSILQGDDLSENALSGYDACCVIGGDGTILGVVCPAVKHGVPVIGINYGKLGFLTTYTQEEADDCLKDLIAGHYHQTHRTLLTCINAHQQEALALNDVVIKSSSNASLVELQVSQNGSLVNTYNSDGLIFSTPTGSTAYNLAAGGPIMHPGSHVLAMTPVSPHTLSNRSMVFPSEVQLSVDSVKPHPVPQIILDGRLPFGHETGSFPVRIGVSEKRFTLLHRDDYDHFTIVRNKLKW